MKTFRVILIDYAGDEEVLFSTNSLAKAKKVFDEFASKGIGKDSSLHLNSINKIRSLYVFE